MSASLLILRSKDANSIDETLLPCTFKYLNMNSGAYKELFNAAAMVERMHPSDFAR